MEDFKYPVRAIRDKEGLKYIYKTQDGLTTSFKEINKLIKTKLLIFKPSPFLSFLDSPKDKFLSQKEIDELFNDWDFHTGSGSQYNKICECGAEKAKSTHANWCPKYKEYK